MQHIRVAQQEALDHGQVGLRGRFETWAGIMVPWDAQTILTGSKLNWDFNTDDDDADLAEAFEVVRVKL